MSDWAHGVFQGAIIAIGGYGTWKELLWAMGVYAVVSFIHRKKPSK